MCLTRLIHMCDTKGLTDDSKARFCFKMVDANNDGVATYEELKTFLLNVMYADSNAKHRMITKVDHLIQNKLGVNTFDRLKEQVCVFRGEGLGVRVSRLGFRC